MTPNDIQHALDLPGFTALLAVAGETDGDPAATFRRKLLDGLRPLCADEIAALKAAGRSQVEKAATLREILGRIDEAEEETRRIADLEQAASAAESEAGRHYARCLATGIGADAESRAAEAEARFLREAVRSARSAAGDRLKLATHAAEIRGEAERALAEANLDLAAADFAFREKRTSLTWALLMMVAETTMRPLTEILAADLAASRQMTGEQLNLSREIRLLARDGVLIRAPDRRTVEQVARDMTAATRRAAGVAANWAHRIPDAERVPPAVLNALPERPAAWRGVSL